MTSDYDLNKSHRNFYHHICCCNVTTVLINHKSKGLYIVQVLEYLFVMSDIIGEIVGLYRSNNGQKCSEHDPCGCHLAESDRVRFKAVTLQFGNRLENAIQAIRGSVNN
jgi:hypothetical protein